MQWSNIVFFSYCLLSLLSLEVDSISPDNICTFHIGGKLFSLLYLDQKNGYELQIDSQNSIFFNFCSAFVPPSCSSSDITTAYSFLARKSDTPMTNYSSTSNQTRDQSFHNGSSTNQSSVVDGEEETNETSAANKTEQVSQSVLIANSKIEVSDQNGIEDETSNTECIRYSSNSYTYYFRTSYAKEQKLGTLHFKLLTETNKQVSVGGKNRFTEFIIECSDYDGLDIEGYSVTEQKIVIEANSLYGCPAFQVSNLWAVFLDNQILFGLILFVLGFYMLFYGRVTIEVTIFVGIFFISFAVIGSIFTLFVSPHSSTFVMYFSFLLLVTVCTLISYGVTRLVNISVFFVGAIGGFIIAMLVNSIFCKITDIYSVWSFVIFVILFTIPIGMLTFKFRDQILIASSSLTGAYLVVRPISWIFGGFPNQFLLYHLIETNSLDTLPWSFFGYLILIVALALIGSMYQLLKFYRQSPEQQIQINAVQGALEQPMDHIKQKVDNLIEKFKSDDNKEYRKMREMKDSPSYPARPRNQMREDDDE